MKRPHVEIDGEEVEKLARLGCTYEEIGAWFGVSGDTIKRRFADEFALGREGGKTSLRRMQWKSAKSGSVPMQIHLGKQYLGQAEKVEASGSLTTPVTMIIAHKPAGVDEPEPESPDSAETEADRPV